MMLESGELARLGDRTPELMNVIAKYGNPACDLFWRNKGSIFLAAGGTAALTAFLSNPEPFINGTKDLAAVMAEHVAAPLAEVPVAIARQTNWTPIVLTIVGMVTLLAALRWRLFRRLRMLTTPTLLLKRGHPDS